jgi:hypothetical protein
MLPALYPLVKDYSDFQLQPYATHSYTSIARGEILQMDCDTLGV